MYPVTHSFHETMMSFLNAVEKLPESRYSRLADCMIKCWNSLKLHSPTFHPVPLFFYHLCLFLFYINGLALFTQQHAMCSMARWSDLGGMLRGLKECVQ